MYIYNNRLAGVCVWVRVCRFGFSLLGALMWALKCRMWCASGVVGWCCVSFAKMLSSQITCVCAFDCEQTSSNLTHLELLPKPRHLCICNKSEHSIKLITSNEHRTQKIHVFIGDGGWASFMRIIDSSGRSSVRTPTQTYTRARRYGNNSISYGSLTSNICTSEWKHIPMLTWLMAHIRAKQKQQQMKIWDAFKHSRCRCCWSYHMMCTLDCDFNSLSPSRWMTPHLVEIHIVALVTK